MKVMSFNLRSDFILDFKNRWDKRKHIVYEIIDKYDCDIIGVQEVTNKMFNDIKENFDDYTIVGKPRSKKYFSERNNLFIKKTSLFLHFSYYFLSHFLFFFSINFFLIFFQASRLSQSRQHLPQANRGELP